MDSMDPDNYFVFNAKFPRSKIYVEVHDDILSILNFETRFSSSAALQIQWWVPTVGLLEYRIRWYVRRHGFGSSLRPGTPLNSPCKLASGVLSWSLTLFLDWLTFT